MPFEFFAVTVEGSLYHVRPKNGGVHVEVSTGPAEPQRKQWGTAVVAEEGLVLYSVGFALELPSERLLTSPLAALFLAAAGAAAALEARDLMPWDERWRKQTLETLRAIHQTESFCLRLSPPVEQRLGETTRKGAT